MNHFCKHLLFPWQNQLNKVNYRLINFENSNKVLRMNEAYFKHLVDEQKIVISFRWVQDINAKKFDRIFNFVRDVNENVDVSLHRIKNNLEKELTKKIKRSKKKQEPTDGENSETLQVRLMENVLKSISKFMILDSSRASRFKRNRQQQELRRLAG